MIVWHIMNYIWSSLYVVDRERRLNPWLECLNMHRPMALMSLRHVHHIRNWSYLAYDVVWTVPSVAELICLLSIDNGSKY